MTTAVYDWTSFAVSAATMIALIPLVLMLARRYHRDHDERTSVELAVLVSIFVGAAAMTVSAFSNVVLDDMLGIAARGILRAAFLMVAIVYYGVALDRRRNP